MNEAFLIENSVERAEEVFGEQTVLSEVPRMVDNGFEAVFGTQYTGMVALLVAIFVVYLVVFLDYVVYFFSTSFSIFSSGMSRQRNAMRSVRNGLESIMAVIGIAAISLFVVRFLVLYHPQWLNGMECSEVVWRVGGAVCAVFAFIILFEILLLWTVGLVTASTRIVREIVDLKLLHFSTSLAVIFPFIAVFMVSRGKVADISLGLSLLICVAFVYVYVKETVAILREHRIPFFLCFLYLCALEIFPITLSMAPVLRGNINL